MHDVVSAKAVVPPEDLSIMDVVCTNVRVLYDSQYYKAQVVDCGE